MPEPCGALQEVARCGRQSPRDSQAAYDPNSSDQLFRLLELFRLLDLTEQGNF